MSTTYVCPKCGTRWKIVPSGDVRVLPVLCPNCTPEPSA